MVKNAEMVRQNKVKEKEGETWFIQSGVEVFCRVSVLHFVVNLYSILRACESQVRIQRGGGGQGVRTPLENDKLYGFL